MNTSESFAQIAAALAAAQGEFPIIPRDRTVRVDIRDKQDRSRIVGGYSFRYAPLETILEKTRPALAKNGLAITQSIVTDERGNEMLRTMLLHSSGEWMYCDVPIFTGSGDNQSQAYASGMTYSRRYGVTLILCVSADEDDDGNGGEQGEGHPRPDYHRSHGSGRGNAQRKINGPRQPQRKPQDQQPAPQREQHQARNVDSGGENTWLGDDLSDGQRNLLQAKAKVAGMDDDSMAKQFGQVTAATVNDVLASLRDIADQ